MLLKYLNAKKTVIPLRTLVVIHYLITHNNKEIIDWLQSTSLTFELSSGCDFKSIMNPYYQFLKQRCKTFPTLSLFLTSNKQNLSHSDLLQATDEVINLTQLLINIKDPILVHLRNNFQDLVPEICSWVFTESEIIYNSLKNAVGSLWQIFTNLELFNAIRARDIFLRYNSLIGLLKEFAGKCPNEYPGLVPTYSLLNEKTFQQVNLHIVGKENVSTSTNLLKFEHVDKDGSPVKGNKRLNSMDFGESPLKNQNQAVNFATVNPVKMMNGFPLYGMYAGSMFYQQQMFYPQLPNNRQ